MTVRSNCLVCGDVTLDLQDIVLVKAPGEAWYEFTCPQCRDLVRKPASDRDVRMLHAVGIRCRDAHPERIPTVHAPLQPEDVLKLHQLLETDTWFDVLVALTPSTADGG
ncbi:MAG: hypothetical protein GEU74_06125 [Nitriliruptorales bacterium]|nr:hypothetical protein [Nitriliruptorales bacterium]